MTSWIDPDKDFESPGGQTFVVGATVGALLVGIVWFALSAVNSGQSPDGGRAGPAPAAMGSEAPSSASPRGPSASPQQPCVAVFDAQTEALESAESSMAQWEVHVGAMNQLVTGAITLTQASAFWNQTRVGAQRRLDRFGTAIESYRSREARCPESRRTYEPAAAPGSCPAAVGLRARTLRRADRALAVWQHHVHDMEMLRNGDITPAQATRMWLSSWRRGAHQINVYRDSATESDRHRC